MPRGVPLKPIQSPHERAARRIGEIDLRITKLGEERVRLLAERKKCEELVEKHRLMARTSVINSVIEKVPEEQQEALLSRLAAMTKEEVSKLLGEA